MVTLNYNLDKKVKISKAKYDRIWELLDQDKFWDSEERELLEIAIDEDIFEVNR